MKKFSTIVLSCLILFCGYNSGYCMKSNKPKTALREKNRRNYPKLLIEAIKEVKSEDSVAKREVLFLLDKVTELNADDYDSVIYEMLKLDLELKDIFVSLAKRFGANKSRLVICGTINLDKINYFRILLEHGLPVNEVITGAHCIRAINIETTGKEFWKGTLLNYAIAAGKYNFALDLLGRGGLLWEISHDESSAELPNKFKNIKSDETFGKFIEDLEKSRKKNIKQCKLFMKNAKNMYIRNFGKNGIVDSEIKKHHECYKNNKSKLKNIKRPSDADLLKMFLGPDVLSTVVNTKNKFLIEKLKAAGLTNI